MKTLQTTILIIILTTVYSIGQNETKNPPEVTIEQLRNNIYLVRCGWASSMTLSAGEDGLLIVDSNLEDNIENIYAAIKEEFSGLDLKYVVSTHHHPDHTGGNPYLLKKGVKSIAHENTKLRMHEIFYGYKEGLRIYDPSKGEAMQEYTKEELPDITFSENMDMDFNGEEIQLIHALNAHTDGDLIIYFTNNNVIALGDNYFGNTYSYGININGMISAYEMVLNLIDDETIIIPGHAGPSSKNDLQTYHSIITEIRSKVITAKRAGKSLEDVVADSTISNQYDVQYENQWIDGPSLRKKMYEQVLLDE